MLNVSKYNIYLDLTHLAIYSSQVNNVNHMFQTYGDYCNNMAWGIRGNFIVDMRNWDFSNVKQNNFRYFAYGYEVKTGYTRFNLLGTKKTNQYIDEYTFTYVSSLVGDTSIDEIVNNDLKVLEGHRGNCRISNNSKGLVDRASLRAFINGLADLTGDTPNTLVMHSSSLQNLTEEDIAIATAKNWTIA